MKLKQYLNEMSADAIKKEIIKLRQSQKLGKLTDLGIRRLEKMEAALQKMGIFDY